MKGLISRSVGKLCKGYFSLTLRVFSRDFNAVMRRWKTHLCWDKRSYGWSRRHEWRHWYWRYIVGSDSCKNKYFRLFLPVRTSVLSFCHILKR